jgi:hypothetical protein
MATLSFKRQIQFNVKLFNWLQIHLILIAELCLKRMVRGAFWKLFSQFGIEVLICGLSKE